MLPLAILAAGMLANGQGSDEDGTDSGGSISGVIGGVSGLLDGLLSNADQEPFRTLGEVNAPWNQAYIAWVNEFYPEKGRGTSSIWDDPGGVQTFRNVVDAWKTARGMSWEQTIGHIDRNMQWRTSGPVGSGQGRQSGGPVVTNPDGTPLTFWQRLKAECDALPMWAKIMLPVTGVIALYWTYKKLKYRRRGR